MQLYHCTTPTQLYYYSKREADSFFGGFTLHLFGGCTTSDLLAADTLRTQLWRRGESTAWSYSRSCKSLATAKYAKQLQD